MSYTKYKIDLDELTDDIFYEMERLSEGQAGHECIISAMNKSEAIYKLFKKLTPFFENLLELDNDDDIA